MGVRIQELPETTGINKEDLLIVEDGQGTKKGTVQQLDETLGVSQLKEDLVELAGQFISISIGNYIDDSYVDRDGIIKNYNGWHRTDYIEIDATKREIIFDTNSENESEIYNCFYDTNKIFIKNFDTKGKNVSIPENAKYMILSLPSKYSVSASYYIEPLNEKASKRDIEGFNSAISNAVRGIFSFASFDGNYIKYENGIMTSSKYWTASDFINVYNVEKVVITVIKDTMYNAFYDSEKNFVRRLSLFKGDNVVAIPDNVVYIRLSTETVNYGKIEVKRYKEGTLKYPTYYDEYMNNRIAEIKSHDTDTGCNGEQFIFITDYHEVNNTCYSPFLSKLIMDNTAVNAVFFGGDAIDSTNSVNEMKTKLKEFADTWDSVSGNKFFPIIGNHEFYSNWQNEGAYKGGITLSEVYSYLSKRRENCMGGYDGIASYFFDNHAQKIRHILVGCDYDGRIKLEQNKWVMQTLVDTPNDYDIVIMTHWALDVDTSGVSSISERFTPIANACDAYNNKSSFNYSDNSYNYVSKNGRVICAISGHYHADGYATTTGGIPVIATTCDAYKMEYTSLERTKGTTNEQAFDVVSIDRINRKVYTTRIGAGKDRIFNY